MKNSLFSMTLILSLFAFSVGAQAATLSNRCTQTEVFQIDNSQYLEVSPTNGTIRNLNQAAEILSQYQFLDSGLNFVDMKIELSNNSELRIIGNSKNFTLRYRGAKVSFFETFDCK